MRDAGLAEPARPVLRAKAKLRYDKVRQRFILLLPEKAVLLNESGAEILQLCDGTRTTGALIDTLRRSYPGADLGSDVVEFLRAAVERGWVDWILPP